MNRYRGLYGRFLMNEVKKSKYDEIVKHQNEIKFRLSDKFMGEFNDILRNKFRKEKLERLLE